VNRSGPTTLDSQLRAVRARLRLLSALGFTTNVLFVAVGLSVLFVAVGRAAEWASLVYWAAVPVAVGLLAGAAYWLLRRPSRLEAAARVDRDLDFRERLSTMIHLEAHPSDREIECVQRTDAAHRAEALPVESVAPVRLPDRARWLVLPLVIALAVLMYPEKEPQELSLVSPPPAAAGGGQGKMGKLSEEERRKIEKILNDPRRTDAQKLEELRRKGYEVPRRAPQKSPAEMIQQIRQALAGDPDRKDAAANPAASRQASPDQNDAPQMGAGGGDGGKRPAEASERADTSAGGRAAPRAVAVYRADYPEYADVLQRYFAAPGDAAR